jgi:hypothetical protein
LLGRELFVVLSGIDAIEAGLSLEGIGGVKVVFTLDTSGEVARSPESSLEDPEMGVTGRTGSQFGKDS